MKTALVLSAGGMYGAYQAGIWKVLSETFQPDIVVGASIGAMNAWAIAGGSTPEALIDRWLNLETLSSFRWRLPKRFLDGIVDSGPLLDIVKQVHSEFVPQLDIGVVATQTSGLRPVLFRGAEVTWQHLAASAAIPGIFSQHRIGNRVYTDGGLLDPVPIWAAAEMGAERIIAVNVLPAPPSMVIRKAAGALRKVMRFRPFISESVRVERITAPVLGSVRDVLYWKRENVLRWVEAGERDAVAHLERVRTLCQPETPVDSGWSPIRSESC